MAAEEDLRHFHAKYLFRFSIVRIFEIVHILVDIVTLVLSTRLFLDDSRDEPGYRFDHDHSWSLAAERDEASEGYFVELSLVMLLHILLETIVDAFISGAYENQMLHCA